MTASNRIVLNTIATYLRSLFAITCGLFSGRWLLMSLGEVDYGLYGVLSGLVAFVMFFNAMFSSATGRFYAYSIGSGLRQARSDEAIIECRKWFSISLLFYISIPLLLCLIGCPIGEWAIRHWLNIPEEKMIVSAWVFRLACLTSFVSMVDIPFRAMYIAKQYIAELTIYEVLQSTANVCFLYYMLVHPREWLLGYAIWVCVLNASINILILIRAVWIFKECRFGCRYCCEWWRIRALFQYSGCQGFSALGNLFRIQGMAILVNKMFGAATNAAMSIAYNVNGHAASLASAMQGAFTPAITTLYGAGDVCEMRKMAGRASKFGGFLAVLFLVPLSLELPYVIELWLKKPPQFAIGLCYSLLIVLLFDKWTIGHMIAVNATGKIAGFQFAIGINFLSSIVVAGCLLVFSHHIYMVGIALVFCQLICTLIRLIYARKLLSMSVVDWFHQTLFPIVMICSISGGIGMLPRLIGLSPSFLRLGITIFLVLPCLVAGIWMGLEEDERLFVLSKLIHLRRKFK